MELSEAIAKRTSVRFYEEREVNDETLKELIKAAIRAPTASGLENWFFVAYKSKDIREKVYELIKQGHIEYFTGRGLPEEKMKKLLKRFEEGMYRAPLYLGVFINKNVRALQGEKYNELEFYFALESAAMAIENLMLKAVELGLGTCYIGVTCFEHIEKELKRMADLGDEYFLVGLITVGYPREEPKPKRRRKSAEDVLKIL
ncbi:nitroreductase family protein [Thermococcus sp. M39]|uniref:nitroreductase family protein n=1 Tax=unclassified Thermococcus TaxID=2627626 RepID=UPI00143B34E9|nr:MULTISPECIES: nitroreductase family protein [unclassified Thermococcus]NJE08826.1 nitroreductase family protein [Thermococcus sp. M39]NJE13487.1 nitroreductase family protein [Thermococcus sp. LS2]